MNPSLRQAFAPGGTLRTALNMGNPVLVHRGGDGEPAGVTVDLARAFAAELGVEATFLQFPTAAESVRAVAARQADLGFMAVDPRRAQGIHFTPPYLEIEGAYAVPAGSPIRANGEVDSAAHRVVVGAGSAYDLFLSRELRQARIVRVPLSEQVVDEMLAQGLEVAAGVRQQLQGFAQAAGARMLDGRFMVIHQAAAIPDHHDAEARRFADGFIERAKATGLLAQSLARHRIEGAAIAPPAAFRDLPDRKDSA